MEIWDLYDETGRKTGETWERSRAREIPEGRYHIVCDVLIRHRDGDFLLTVRYPGKEMYPGCLEASAGVTRNPGTRSAVYAYLAAVNCGKDSVRLQKGETSGYRWVDTPTFLRMIREEPVLKIQYPRYRPYLDTLEKPEEKN